MSNSPAVVAQLSLSSNAVLNPSTLFSAAEKGYWLDPSDITTMWQDSAGTTPVTTLGDPVGRMLDKSGNGYIFTQATAANRPTWNQDASGYYYLNFDGTNDSLLSTASVNIAGSDKVTVACAVDRQSASAQRYIIDAGYGTTGGWGLYAAPGTNNGPAFAITRSSNGYKTLGGPTLGLFLASARIDFAQTTLDLEIGHRMNGRPGGPYTVGGVTAGAGDFVAMTNSIGCYRLGASNYFLGKFYGAIVRQGLLSNAQLIGIENFLNSKSGIW
jgi:hypothetical protein